MSSSTAPASTPIPTARVWLRGLLAAVIASVLNVIIAAVEVPAFAISSAQLSLQPGPIVASTVIGSIGGTVVFLILRRVSSRGERLFVIVAIVVALLSLLLPVAVMVSPMIPGGGSVVGGAALIPLHLTAAATVILALTVRTPARTTTTAGARS